MYKLDIDELEKSAAGLNMAALQAELDQLQKLKAQVCLSSNVTL